MEASTTLAIKEKQILNYLFESSVNDKVYL